MTAIAAALCVVVLASFMASCQPALIPHPSDTAPSADHQLLVNEVNNVSTANETSVEEGASFLTKLVAHIFEMLDLKEVIQDIKQSKTTAGTCYSCKFGIALLQHLLEFGKGKEELAALAQTICVMLRVEQPRVCQGIVNVFKVSSRGDCLP